MNLSFKTVVVVYEVENIMPTKLEMLVHIVDCLFECQIYHEPHHLDSTCLDSSNSLPNIY